MEEASTIAGPAAAAWEVADGLVDYDDACARMEARVADIRAGRAGELVWLLEHPPLYTAGTSAQESDLLAPNRFPVYRSPRGGQYTYHGPGQRVVYPMLDLKARGLDLRGYIRNLERWIIATLSHFTIEAGAREGRVGVWVPRPDGREEKIAAIGVRVRRWVSFHGIAINLDPDLEHFSGIVPCGIGDKGVTSLRALGIEASMADLDAALWETFQAIFGDVAAESVSTNTR